VVTWKLYPYESTDSAFVEGRIVQMAPRVGGQVLELSVNDNQSVHKGDTLCVIDPADYMVQVERAQAALDAAKAKLDGAVLQVGLTKVTTSTGLEGVSASLDVQKAQVEMMRNQISQAKAAIRSAKAVLGQQQALAKAAEAEAKRAHADLERLRSLSDKSVSRQALDKAEADDAAVAATAEAARRRIVAAESALTEAEVAHEGSLFALKQAEHQAAVMESRVEDAQAAPKRVAASETELAGVQAEAALRSAELEQAKLNLSYTRVLAPCDGFVTRRAVEAGNFVQPGQTLMAIVSTEVWVVANFKESQLQHIKIDQPVSVSIDAFPGVKVKGKVESFQKGTGARFSLMPPENATGNFVKVVQRIPVKIVFDSIPSDLLLVPGMSVVPSVRIK
jgi:membrane fusion protein (multidrug efflux system)